MKFHLRVLVMLMLLTAVFLVACGGEEEPTPVPPTAVPPTAVPTDIPPTEVPTEVPPTEVPTEVPPTSTSEPAPESDTAMMTHESVDGGYTIAYPEAWFANEIFGMGLFSSIDVSLEEMGDMTDLNGGTVIVMGGALAEIEGDDPMDMLDQASADFDFDTSDAEAEIVEGPTAVTINGNEGAMLSIRGDADGTAVYATIVVLTNGINDVVVMAISPAADEEMYAPTFDAMINSIEISEDELADPFGDMGMTQMEIIDAGNLVLGEAVAGLTLEDTSMTWSFEGVAGTAYNLVATPTDGDFDITVDIIDETGVSILPFGEVDDAFGEETVAFDIATDGTYRVALQGFAGSSGAYTLLLTDGGVANTSATGNGEVLFTETVSGVVADDETTTYEFEGVAGSIINVVVTPTDDDLDAVVDIVDVDGNSIIGGEVDEEFDTEQILGVVIPADGTYYVSIRGFAGGGGAYDLTYTEVGETTGDAGNSGHTAVAGETITGVVPDGETVTWEFSGNANEIVNIIVTPTDDDLDVVVDVLDADGYSIIGGEVDEGFDVEEVSNIVLPADGTYSVALRGFAGGGGGYELVFNGGDGSTATPTGEGGGSITYGELVMGEVTAGGSNVWTFNASEGDFVDVTVEPYDDFDIVLDVVDSAGNSMLFDGATDASFDTEFVRVVPIMADGQYTIIITPYADGESGTYDMVLNETLLGGAGSILFVHNEFIDPEDEGFIYPFTAAAGEYVTVYVVPDSLELDVVLGVYYEETDELIEEIDNSTGREELIFYADELDNYYFLVTNYEGTIGGFDLTLSGSQNVIYEIAVGDGIVGRLINGEILNYGYYGEAGTTVSFVIESDENMDMSINLEDADGNILADMDDGLAGEGEILTYTFEESLFTFVNVSEFYGEAGNFALYVE